MKPPQYLIAIITSAFCIFLSIYTCWTGHELNQASQALEKGRAEASGKIQAAQEEINRGNQSFQIISNIVNEIDALTNEKTGKRDDNLRSLLAKDVEGSHIINISAPSPTPGSTSPAASPSTSSTSSTSSN